MLYDSSFQAHPLEQAGIAIKIMILDPTRTCILYEESQTVDTSSTAGKFTIQVGSAASAAKRGASDSGNTMAAVYQNVASVTGKQVTNAAVCTYAPVSGDTRYVRLQVTPPASVTSTLSPDIALDAVPMAAVAESLQGLSRTDVLALDPLSQLTQANVANLFSNTNYTKLSSLVAGTSPLYLPASSTAGAELPTYTTASPPASLVKGSIWYDSTANQLKYYNGSVQTVSAGISSQWTTIAGPSIYYNSGNVGIGTASPLALLHVAAAPTATANFGLLSLGNGLFDGASTGHFAGSASGTTLAANNASGYSGNLIDLQIAGTSKFKVDATGKVYGDGSQLTGIAASSYSGTLAVANGGTGTATGSITGSGALAFAAGGTNQNITLTPSGTGATLLGGNVGVGTTSPVSVLDVNGDVRVGATAASCTPAKRGAIRYNTSSNILEFCNGTGWNTVQAAACSNATPTAFSFTDVANQSLSTVVQSNIVQVSGMNCLVPVGVSGTGSPSYRICQDVACSTVLQSWTTGASSIQSGQYVQLQQTTNSAGGVTNQATMIVGGAGSVWSATTSGTCSFGATETAAIGTRCGDGTIYAGLSPDGNGPMYTTPCDNGQTWNSGSQTCTGSATKLSWNNGTNNNFVATGSTSTAAGRADTAGANALTSNADYPYQSTQNCAALTLGGHNDWYLPAEAELNTLYNNNGVIGNFDQTGTLYWSSTENQNVSAYYESFFNGSQGNNYKDTVHLVRCVRRY